MFSGDDIYMPMALLSVWYGFIPAQVSKFYKFLSFND